MRHSGLRKQQVTDSTNREAVFLRRRPDERNNSSLKRLIAAGLELLSLPARGSASGKNEERARKGESERSSGRAEEREEEEGEEDEAKSFRYFAHAGSRTQASTHALAHATRTFFRERQQKECGRVRRELLLPAAPTARVFDPLPHYSQPG